MTPTLRRLRPHCHGTQPHDPRDANLVVCQREDGPIALGTFLRLLRSVGRIRNLHRHHSASGRILRLCIGATTENTSQLLQESRYRTLSQSITNVLHGPHVHPLQSRRRAMATSRL
jgi:hypothetical protein